MGNRNFGAEGLEGAGRSGDGAAELLAGGPA